MPPEFISSVFDTFTRANISGSAKTEGTGLGMAIPKCLVELMGGTISCDSTLGEGATFTVSLHMKLAGDKDIIAQSSALGIMHRNQNDNEIEAVDLSGKRILLVEDNTMNTEIVHAIISETGAEIIDAHNGKEAVDTFAAHEAGYFNRF